MLSQPILHKPWPKEDEPKKILAIRFQALGDLMITLPYLQSLKDQLPHLKIHLLTRKEVAAIPKNLVLFEKVFSVRGGRNAKVQFLFCLIIMPYLMWQKYDVIIDLQNHRISKIIRKLLNAKAWSEFDRTSKVMAGERTRLTIDSVKVKPATISTRFELKQNLNVPDKLKSKGWNGTNALVILNPAGAFSSRNWPINNYVSFAKQWLERNPSSQFLMLGLNGLKPKASRIENELGDKFIDLIESTSVAEAFAIIKMATLMITEDSGLMHMAWVQGVPTVALFGSSPSYWSSPLGQWSCCLNSSDLPCGDCFLEECKFGDVRCLTRVSPEKVVEAAENVLKL